MNNLNQIKLLPAREQAAAAIRKAILSKELAEGVTITLDDIAKQLGVSITPVREAFQILARDGLIKLRPNKGAVILGLNQKTIRDHYTTRALLEREAAALACRIGADTSQIKESFEQGEDALKESNPKKYSNCNQAFHMAIWAAADNERMKSILSSMWNGSSTGLSGNEKTALEISSQEHKEILEAIVDHDEETARNLMNKHILKSMDEILSLFE